MFQCLSHLCHCNVPAWLPGSFLSTRSCLHDVMLCKRSRACGVWRCFLQDASAKAALEPGMEKGEHAWKE